jgi:type VI secretion system protein ImpE
LEKTVNADELYREGRLSEAIDALNEVLRADPTDVKSRTFLFELLCFSGQFERARRQLDAIGAADPELNLSAAWYQEALVAEEKRHEMFLKGDLPVSGSSPSPVQGTLNGKPFTDLRDGDPRLGPRLEIIVGGRYTWMPLEHLATLSMEPPKRLRDLYWAPVQIETTQALDGYAGEALLPVMTPLAWQHPEEVVRLGRQTDWIDLESGEEAPVGQKLLLVDDEEFPLLEVRELLVNPPDR